MLHSWHTCSTVPLTTLIRSHSEGVDPRLISENSTVLSSPNYRSSEDYFDPHSALPSQNVPDSDVEDEEEPFLSPRLFKYVLVDHVTNVSPKYLHIE